MPSPSLRDILADGGITEAQVQAIFDQYDTDDSGYLERDELLALARAVSALLIRPSVDDVLQIMDFYQQERDGRFDRRELREFLDVYLGS